MLTELKVAIIRRGVGQSRMAIALGWDPSKLSRIVNGLTIASVSDRKAIANYLGIHEAELFAASKTSVTVNN